MTRLQRARVSASTFPGLRVVCLACSAMVEYRKAWVDLDGPAFKAYYHAACVPECAEHPDQSESDCPTCLATADAHRQALSE